MAVILVFCLFPMADAQQEKSTPAAKPQYGGVLRVQRMVGAGNPIGDVPEMGPSGLDVVNLHS
jgi:hypothetical protein